MNAVWLVVPCYNEEKRLMQGEFSQALKDYPWLYLCFVDDASTDSTKSLLDKMSNHERVTVIGNVSNMGKAASVRVGVLHGLSNTKCDKFGYWDADLATPFDELGNINRMLDSSKNSMLIMGARVMMLGRSIVRKRSRHYIGRGFATIASIILKSEVYDTQCGAKLFTREFAEISFSDELTTKWCFDIELLLRFQKHYKSTEVVEDKVIEFPLETWTDVDGSKVKMHHILGVVGDLMKLFYKSRT